MTGRANRDGDPCPPWCTAGHGRLIAGGITVSAHRGDTAAVTLGEDGCVLTSPVWLPGEGRAGVLVITPAGGSLFLAPGTARDLASLVEQLAGATPDQHREAAAAIRAAAAVTEETH